jgi:hypothetical protein
MKVELGYLLLKTTNDEFVVFCSQQQEEKKRVISFCLYTLIMSKRRKNRFLVFSLHAQDLVVLQKSRQKKIV